MLSLKYLKIKTTLQETMFKNFGMGDFCVNQSELMSRDKSVQFLLTQKSESVLKTELQWPQFVIIKVCIET